MKTFKKAFNDKDRLDFLFNYNASVPIELPDGRWAMQVKAGAVLRTFTGATPRLCIDSAIVVLKGRKAYIYDKIKKESPRIQP